MKYIRVLIIPIKSMKKINDIAEFYIKNKIGEHGIGYSKVTDKELEEFKKGNFQLVTGKINL
jgi:hypothetical protein